jgi:hypothetical protein
MIGCGRIGTPAPRLRPFDELTVPGCVMSLNPSRGVTLNGSNASAVADQSGSGTNAAQATPSKQPLAVGAAFPNGRPALSLDGGDALSTPAVALGAHAWLLQLKLSGGAGSVLEHNDIPGGLGSNGAGLSGSINNTIQVNRAGSASSWNHASNWAVDGATRVVTVSYDGTHAGHSLRINRAAVALTNVTANDPGTGSVNAPLYLGSRGPAGSESLFSTGLYGRALGYNRVPWPDEVARLEGLLAREVGLD